MKVSYARFKNLVKSARYHNIAPKILVQNIVELSQNKPLSIINDYFTKCDCEKSKLFLITALPHLNLKNCDEEELEKLARNISCLIRPSHKSIISILETLKKILKHPSICPEARLNCLFEILIRTNKSLYPVNKPIEELCKCTIKLLPPELQTKIFSQCMEMIKKSLYADINCIFFAELLKYVSINFLFESIPVLLQYICCGFCANITAVQRSYVYKILVERLDFPEWKNRVFPLFINLFNELYSNECFLESIKSYFIPLSALKYKEDFYVACRHYMSNCLFCADVLVYLTRRGLCNLGDFQQDVTAFCHENASASLGFELLCKTDRILEILNFFYEYKWLEDKEKNICSFKEVNIFSQDVFNFSVVLLNSTSRSHVEFGRGLLKIGFRKNECDRKYWRSFMQIYLKNSAVSADFIYDLLNTFGYDRNFFNALENNTESKNIGCLTKASCIKYISVKNDGTVNDFILTVNEKLDNIDGDTFKNGSTLFYIKTLKLFCEEATTDNKNSQQTFYTLSKAVITLLHLNIAQKLHTTDERKLYEAALSDILSAMYSLLRTNKIENFAEQLLHSCFLTIQQSNFKQPVNTASSIFRKAASFSTSKVLSTLIDTCFQSLYSHTANMSTIRCSAEYRLVLENICVADSSGLLTKEVFSRLLKLLKEDGASEFSIEAALHAAEALLSNRSLQTLTRCYIEEIVEIVLEKKWMRSFKTRNAVIQVWRTVINTFKGAPLEKTFLEYNRLAYIFYRTMATGANEKLLLILSMFAECPQGMYLLKPNLDNILNPFTTFFVHYILNEAGYCGRFAAEAYAAQCQPDAIAVVLYDITAFTKLHGVIPNIVILVRALVDKYLFYFRNLNGICHVLCIFLKLIRPCQISFTDIQNYGLDVDLLVSILNKVEHKPQLLFDSLNMLILKAINLQTNCLHSLQIYAQTIFLLYEKRQKHQSKCFIVFKHINTSIDYSLYHFAIFSLLFSHGTDFPVTVKTIIIRKLFKYYRKVSKIQDPESLAFFATTLPYVYQCAETPKQKLIVFKLAVIFMVCGDTDDEFCQFIASINNSKLTNLMCSVKTFLSYKQLLYHLQCDDAVFAFLVDTSVYISQFRTQEENLSFYSIDTESHSLAIPVVKQMLFKCFKELYLNNKYT